MDVKILLVDELEASVIMPDSQVDESAEAS